MYNSFMQINKAIFALMGVIGCSNAPVAPEAPWSQLQGCWRAVPSEQEARERLILQVVLSAEEPDMTSFQYSVLSPSERVLVAQWRLERAQNPTHPRWSGMVERMALLSDSMICLNPHSVAFKSQAGEEVLPVRVVSQEPGHIQLGHEGEIWDLWWSEAGSVDFNRTGLSPIRLARDISNP